MKFVITLLCLWLSFCTLTVKAQEEVPFTSLNEITLNLQGNNITYSYFSNKLLFRFDPERQKLELRVPLASFTPANTGSPQVLLHDLLLAGQFPELIITFNAPMDLLQTQDLKPQSRRLDGVLFLQGTIRDIRPEVYFIPLPNQFTLSTYFDFSVFGPGVEVPRSYAGMVKGPVEIVIEKARWIYNQQNAR